MYRRPPRSSRTYTLLPSTTLFRSVPTLLQHPGTVACYCVLCATGVDGPGNHAHPRRGYLGEPAMDARQFCAFGHPYFGGSDPDRRSEEHTSELQPLMRISYAVFCLKKKKIPLFCIYNHTQIL